MGNGGCESGGPLDLRGRTDVAMRLRQGSVPRGECVEWAGARLRGGYGVIQVDGRPVKTHRAALALREAVPSGACVLHSCDNPACVSPSHLRVGTHRENMADRQNRRRQRRLSEGVAAGLAEALASGAGLREASRSLGVSPSTVQQFAHSDRCAELVGVPVAIRPVGGVAWLTTDNLRQVFELRAGGKSQAIIAATVGVTQGYVSGLLSGRYRPDETAALRREFAP